MLVDTQDADLVGQLGLEPGQSRLAEVAEAGVVRPALRVVVVRHDGGPDAGRSPRAGRAPRPTPAPRRPCRPRRRGRCASRGSAPRRCPSRPCRRGVRPRPARPGRRCRATAAGRTSGCPVRRTPRPPGRAVRAPARPPRGRRRGAASGRPAPRGRRSARSTAGSASTSSSRFIWKENGVSSSTAGPGGQAAKISRWTRTIVGAVSPEPMTTILLMTPQPPPVRPGPPGRRRAGRGAGRAGRGRRRRTTRPSASGRRDSARSGPAAALVAVAPRHGGRDQGRDGDLRQLGRHVGDHNEWTMSRWWSRASAGRAFPSPSTAKLPSVPVDALVGPVGVPARGTACGHLVERARREVGRGKLRPAVVEGREALAERDPSAVHQGHAGHCAVPCRQRDDDVAAPRLPGGDRRPVPGQAQLLAATHRRSSAQVSVS